MLGGRRATRGRRRGAWRSSLRALTLRCVRPWLPARRRHAGQFHRRLRSAAASSTPWRLEHCFLVRTSRSTAFHQAMEHRVLATRNGRGAGGGRPPPPDQAAAPLGYTTARVVEVQRANVSARHANLRGHVLRASGRRGGVGHAPTPTPRISATHRSYRSSCAPAAGPSRGHMAEAQAVTCSCTSRHPWVYREMGCGSRYDLPTPINKVIAAL